MWTSKNRGLYNRGRLRYPSDLTDEEWALVVFAPLSSSRRARESRRRPIEADFFEKRAFGRHPADRLEPRRQGDLQTGLAADRVLESGRLPRVGGPEQ
jgi:hypothetical protein